MGIILGADIGRRVAVREGAFGQQRRRRITPEAGRAIEILGHAIEYLTDEYVHEKTLREPDGPQLDAIQLLMSLNRQIYMSARL